MTEVLRVNASKPEAAKIKKAAAELKKGGLVVFPTETVYGLGASLLDKRAVEKIYEIKKRPKNKPLTVHVADTASVRKIAGKIPAGAERLIKKYWPGPLTIILRDSRGKKTGFRMPDNKIAFCLIKKAGVPVVAPSANISGNKPPTSAAEVLRDLDGKVDIVIDGGKTAIGIESTVVDMTGRSPKVLREGAIPKAEIERI
ncbi:MAG: L-threonylcarbamoyladenylate synthase [Candidatus Omnitrophica bacterium]|nr:L-threonylcarbamoyladenylate synthase [Candidatus Omnitrophota bacterium]MDD5311118.1 L-threonylcarbamoyladenylate synthase [Candidatus Omnitrophota bacterium]MDD5546442.1 L-threonylcarbamoyladenylate synthase [Candidatus Omnitrophota bacterium]